MLDTDGLSCVDIDECENEADNCHVNANCTNTIGSFTCQCKEGYMGNGITCDDIDECAINEGGCEHMCSNTIGSFYCSCFTGYRLDPNGLNCSGELAVKPSVRKHMAPKIFTEIHLVKIMNL